LFSGESLDSERRRLERPNFLEQMLVSKLYVIELLFECDELLSGFEHLEKTTVSEKRVEE